jgi:hypothetical protein
VATKGNRLGRYNVYDGAAVKIDFKLDRNGFKKIALGPEVHHACHDVVERYAKPTAEVLAEPFRNTGDYARSFRIENTTTVKGPDRWPMLRTAVRLVNISDHALAVEVGGKNPRTGEATPAHHVLRNTLLRLIATGVVTARKLPRARGEKRALSPQRALRRLGRNGVSLGDLNTAAPRRPVPFKAPTRRA